jgi:lipopolysaccharide export system protein LptA
MQRQHSWLRFFTGTAIVFSTWTAFADTAVIQNGTQDTVIYGNKNRVIQFVNQASAVNGGSGATGGDTGLVQDSAQGITIVGDKNRVRQVMIQSTSLEDSKPGRHKQRGRLKNSLASAD